MQGAARGAPDEDPAGGAATGADTTLRALEPRDPAAPPGGPPEAWGRRTVASYVAAFGPGPAWDELVRWPPDAFAVASLVLDHAEAYRFVVAPPPGRSWPALPGWNEAVSAAAAAWRAASGRPRGEPPPLVQDAWDAVMRRRETPLAAVRSGEAWELVSALLTLHAAADEACARVVSGHEAAPRSFEGLARRRLRARGSLARLSPTRVRILPKTAFSPQGITIRSLSRHLALSYEAVEVRWRTVEPRHGPPGREHALVLVPWPLRVDARDFRPVTVPALGNMDVDRFGFFEYAPEPADRGRGPAEVVAAALEGAGEVDAVVLPEGAVLPGETGELERVLEERGASLLVAGVREPAAAGSFGRNYLHFGVRAEAGWERWEQDKHHRWCLDGPQIRQYRLTRSLDPRKLWWEAIDLRERALHVVDLGGGVTAAPLVCEDLARLDEVADVVRRLGPSLVVALLLDGPQLASRWASRYSSILADEPGSTVLTLTSLGMAARCRAGGRPPSRVVAHWNNRADGLRELALAPGAVALLLTAAVERRTLWTADGRRHADVPGLRLAGVRQLSARRRAATARRASRGAGAGRARGSRRSP
jgi:hypothetical protein